MGRNRSSPSAILFSRAGFKKTPREGRPIPGAAAQIRTGKLLMRFGRNPKAPDNPGRMADRQPPPGSSPADLRAQVRERLSALKGELERLRFETDRRWDELLARLTDHPEEIVPAELLRPVPQPADSPAMLPGIASESVRRLDSAGTQIEALTRFLEECRRHADRCALLVDRGGRLEVWKSSGFAADTGRAGPRSAAIEPSSVLDRVREGSPQWLLRGNAVSEALGAGDAAEAVLVPFVVREKVSGAVYADVAGERERFDWDAVAVLTWIAGLVVDRLARRKLVPSPPLRELEIARPAPRDEIPAAPSFASTPPRDHPAAPLPRDGGIPPPAPAAIPVVTEEEGERPLGGPLAPQGEEELRDEARRFARLLASEIKLYNEREVSEGRHRGDLYERLRGDIERGRRLYEERVPPEVRAGKDYYYEELVDVLAGGQPEALR